MFERLPEQKFIKDNVTILHAHWSWQTITYLFQVSNSNTVFELSISQCDQFFHYCDGKETSIYYFAIQNFVRNIKKQVHSIYIAGIMFAR